MSTMAAYETGEELLALAQQHGQDISRTQLARWHRAGLLPRPQQQPLHTARGTRSLYPPGTGEQLVLLCALHTSERRLAHLAWQLWLAGYPVELHLIRDQFMQAARRLTHWSEWFSTFMQDMQKRDSSEQMLDFLEYYATGNLSLQPLRRVRKRVGSERFPSFLRILIELASDFDNSAMDTYDEHERLFDLRILALGLGLEKRFVQKTEALEYYLVRFLLPQLRWSFARLKEVRWEQLIGNATDFDLLQTRDDLCDWLSRWARARQYQRRFPDDYPRWHINLQEIFSSLSTVDQAVVLSCWLALSSSSSSRFP